jgi:hypothetical protein
MSNPRLAVLLAFLMAGLGMILAGRQPAEAVSISRFVAPNGAGAACSQALPCSLQVALTLTLAGDSIYVAGGTYTGTAAQVLDLGKSVALYGSWDGAPAGPIARFPALHSSVLDGQGLRRVVRITGDVTPTLDGFTITGGNATGLTTGCPDDRADGCGGGIFILNAHPIISNNTITNNVAAVTTAGYPTGTTGYGGGIYAAGATRMQIIKNVIISNTGSLVNCGQGGGILLYPYGNGVFGTSVQANQILSNTATTTNLGCAWGGGVSGGPDGVVIQGNMVAGNRANGYGGGQGAGLYQWYGSALYYGNLVTGNLGAASGQAIYAGYSQSRFEANRVMDNATTQGIQLINGSTGGPWLVNNVVGRSGDESIALLGSGGHPLTVTLLNNTVIGAGAGRGVDVETAYVTVLMTNTILAGQTWGITNTFPASSTILASHTLFWGNAHDGPLGDAPVYGDPAFADDGYHIGLGSAALDAGAPLSSVATDVDGEPRPNGPAWDIGADEAQLRRIYLPIVLRQ